MDQPTPPTDRSPRRSPPPDATGDEAAYLAKLREQRTIVAVQLLDGTVLRGLIEYYDRDMIHQIFWISMQMKRRKKAYQMRLR